MQNFKNTILYIKPIVMKYKWQFYGIFLVSAIRIILLVVVTPIFYKRIIDVISKAGIDKATVSHSLFLNIFLIIAVLPLSWIFSRITQYMVSKFQSSVIKDLHDFSFQKLHSHSYSFFANHFSGALVNKSRKFVRAFEVMHDIAIDRFWNSFIVMTSIFIVFFTQVPAITFIFFGMAIIYIFVVFFMSRQKLKYDMDEAVADSKVTAYLADSITNSLAIKASSALNSEIEGFNEITKKESVFRLRAWLFGNKINAIQAIITYVVQIIVTLFTGYLWLHGSISAGIFVLVQSYSIAISNSLYELGQASTKFTKAFSDMKEMVDIFKQVPDVLDVENPEKSQIKEGNIEIKNISFDYAEGTDVFKNFSLKINSGEKIGLVGHSGSGKSTFTKLLMRFINIKEGEILIDGQNIKNLKQDDLHDSISYISQDPILFHRSIRNNIAYSKPNATEEQIVSAAKSAHAHEFILNLKHGYDTLVGERGVKLSGGERQRVAIARAMLKNSPILMLDEATSSLDSVSEHYIQDAFNELMKGKTTIVIAHRLSTIQKMDRIIVLDKGAIVEEGIHKELLAKGGMYANLWSHQTGGFLE